MRRRTWMLALIGLFTGLSLADDALANGGHRGQTYHYNGYQGYWAGGYTACAPAAPVQTQCYAAQPATYAPQPAYYPPQPAYTTPQQAVYVPAQTLWRRR